MCLKKKIQRNKNRFCLNTLIICITILCRLLSKINKLRVLRLLILPQIESMLIIVIIFNKNMIQIFLVITRKLNGI